MILWVFMLLVKSDQCDKYKFCKPKVVGRPRYDETKILIEYNKQ